jgi:hypothetical protein
MSFNNKYKIFTEKRQKWEMLNIKNYQYNISSNGNGKMFIFNVLVKIENGNYIDNEEFKKLNSSIYEYLTIEDIYNDIEKNYLFYKNGLIKKIGHGINVQYDEIYHFPKKVKYSWIPIPFIMDYGSYYMYEIKNFNEK